MKNKKIYTIGLSGETRAMDALALCFEGSKQKAKGFTVIGEFESEDVRFHFSGHHFWLFYFRFFKFKIRDRYKI